MFIHVIPRARLAHLTGILTYRTDQQVQVGQLVLVPLRGRIVPGIVAVVKVHAGYRRALAPVKKVGGLLPASFIRFLTTVADHYALNPAQIFSLLAPSLNRNYVTPDLPAVGQVVSSGQQRLYLTPSQETPLAQWLARRAVSWPTAAAARRALWLQAAAGHPLTISGTSRSVALPFANLKAVTVDTPLASSYRDKRAPGFDAVNLAALAAETAAATLTVRSVIPLNWLMTLFSLPARTRLVRPPLFPISLLPLHQRAEVNDQLAAELRTHMTAGRRILIFTNLLPARDSAGRPYGLVEVAAELRKYLGHRVASWQKNQPLPAAPVVVATATALYRAPAAFDRAYILSLESLLSDQRPYSPLEAVETLGILAARYPLTVQLRDPEHWLAALVKRQLAAPAFHYFSPPLFNRRLLTFYAKSVSTKSAGADDIPTKIKSLWPETLGDNTRLTAISDAHLTAAQTAFIRTLPRGWKVYTRDNTLPKG